VEPGVSDRVGASSKGPDRVGQSTPRRLDSWLLVHAAARLSEGIDTEQSMLTGMFDRARRNSPR
jgi:hypothetical protein